MEATNIFTNSGHTVDVRSICLQRSRHSRNITRVSEQTPRTVGFTSTCFCLRAWRLDGHDLGVRGQLPEASLLGMHMATFSPCPNAGISVCVLRPSTYKDTSLAGSRPTLMALF